MQKNGSRHAKKAKNTKGSKLADLAYMRPSAKDNVVPCTQLRWHHQFGDSTSKEISDNAKKANNAIKAVKYNTKMQKK